MTLLYFAFVLLVLAAVPYRPTEAVVQGYRYSLIAAGLACYIGHLLFRL
jgi:hypothetical protein